MVICPNCGKVFRDNFSRCRICGCRLDGNELGDCSTDMLNVFTCGEGFMYLFSENGNQVIITAGSMDELAKIVSEKKYPWKSGDWK